MNENSLNKEASIKAESKAAMIEKGASASGGLKTPTVDVSAISKVANSITAKAPSTSVGNPTVAGTVANSGCTPDASANQYSAIYPSLVSAVMVILGWIVINKAQANRERRKQIREHVENLLGDLDTLENLVIEYHTTERAIEKERQIITKLGRFEKACSTLPRFITSQISPKAVKASALQVSGENLQKLRQALTLPHFADEHLLALRADDVIIQTIELAAEQVQEDLEGVRIAALD